MNEWTTRLGAKRFALWKKSDERISEGIRLAIAKYIASESKRNKAAREPLYGPCVGKPLWMSAETDGD